MPRRKSKAAQDEAQAFAVRDFDECVNALDVAQGAVDDAKEIMDAAKQAAKDKGFDAKLMDDMRKLKNKVDAGKVTLAAAQAKITNTEIYARAIGLFDQSDLFRDGSVTVTVEDGEGRPLN